MKSLVERVTRRLNVRGRRKDADLRDFPRWLRLCREWRKSEAENENDREPEQVEGGSFPNLRRGSEANYHIARRGRTEVYQPRYNGGINC